jgi:hypothetical protein
MARPSGLNIDLAGGGAQPRQSLKRETAGPPNTETLNMGAGLFCANFF